MKLIFNLVHPTHYYQYLIDQIIKDGFIDVEAVYFSGKLDNYPWRGKLGENLKTYYLKKFYRIDFKFLFKRRKNEINFVAGWIEPTMIILLTYWAIIGKPFLIVTDTVSKRERSGLKKVLRNFWLERFIFQKALAILTTGEVGVNAFKSNKGYDFKVINFPFVTNLDFFSKNSSMLKAYDEFVLFSSGRLDINHKGYDKVIIALGRLKNEYPELKFKYLIAGVGNDFITIKKLAEDYNLNNNVQFLGWLEISELLFYYNQADLFLHTSNFDPYPNAVLEAMACGIPVLGSSQAGSVVDRIISGHNGLIHQSESIDDLYLKLVQFLEMPTVERLQLGVNARKTAEKWNCTFNIDVLKKILKSV